MRKFQSCFIVVLALALSFLLCGVPAFGQQQISEDRTLSPYFFVQSDRPGEDRLPLKSTAASARISGVIADVLVTQIYKNEGKRPLEAVYVFPASTRAAVYGMKMTIGKRVIEAKIKKREEARRDYERARDEGKSASLLEQQRPNVFQMNVANIMPGDEIRVELKYTELIVPTEKVYEFVYPAVVGPRYSNQKASAASPADRWVENPYLHEGELSGTAFDVAVRIDAGMPIAGLTCPSHKVDAVYAGASRVNVSLGKSETHGGNRDYILRYRLDGDRIQTGLLLTQGEKENFFVLMMQPPKRTAAAEMPGREYVFIVDVSGSMYGFPLSISKKLLADLIGRLRPTDRFNVLLFSGGSSLMAEESLPAAAENVQRAITVIERQRGGGGTELLPALKRALSLKREEGFSRSLVVVTDGFVAVEEDAFDLIRKNLGDANLFAFGIGSSVNRHLIEGMAHVGMGEPFIITKPDAAAAQAERFRKMIESPVLTRVKVAFKGFKAYDVEPLSVPDVLAERPVLVFGKWRGALKGTVALSGLTGKGPYTQTINVENYKADKGNEALKYLWARHRITILSDYNKLRTDEKRVKEITDLGLAYNLLTAYTSFVAVDHEVRNVDGKWTTVEQPLPLPEGVSDYAVGGRGHYAAAPAMQMSRPMTGGAKKMESLPAADGLSDKEQPALEKKDKAQAVRVVDVKTEKGLTREDVLKAVQSSLKSVEKCLAAGRFSGVVKVHLTINPDGALKNVAIDPVDIKDAKMRQCLIDAIKQWHFPKTAGGGAVNVVVTLQI